MVMKQKFTFSLRVSDDYEENNYGFAESSDYVDPVTVYQGFPLEEEWQEPFFRMEYGEHIDFIDNDCDWIICSSKLKEVIEYHIGSMPNVVWLPAKVQNDEEVRTYYICLITSFLKMEDVLDIKNSRTLKNGEIYLPCFDLEKLKGKHFFALENFNNEIFISKQLKDILQKENFTGLGFEDWGSV